MRKPAGTLAVGSMVAIAISYSYSLAQARGIPAARSMLDAEERELVHKLKLRDEAAFSAFVLKYQERVFRLLLRMLGDRAEAEDLAQEVFISIFKAIDGFRGDSQLSTWVYRVAANHCRNRIKYLVRRRRQLTEAYDESDQQSYEASAHARPEAPDQLMEARQTEALLQEGLLSLDEDQRELLVLREVEHLSYEEIMAITGLPEGTVKSRLHRARAGLREHIERHERGRRR